MAETPSLLRRGWWQLHNLRQVARAEGRRYALHWSALMLRGHLMAQRDAASEAGFSRQEMQSAAPGGFNAVATPPLVIATLLHNLPADLRDYSFIDIGAGLGHALRYAATREFRELIGWEYGEAVAALGREQIARSPEAARIRIEVGDARAFTLPGGPVVLFLNNPFDASVMREFLAHLRAQWAVERPPLWLGYLQQRHEPPSDLTPNLELLEGADFLRPHRIHFASLQERFLLGSHDLRLFSAAT